MLVPMGLPPVVDSLNWRACARGRMLTMPTAYGVEFRQDVIGLARKAVPRSLLLSKTHLLLGKPRLCALLPGRLLLRLTCQPA
jgi:hypothetical protein